MKSSHVIFFCSAVIVFLLVYSSACLAWSNRWVPNLSASLSIGKSHVQQSSAELISISTRSMLSSSVYLLGRYVEPLSLVTEEEKGAAFARSALVAMGLRLDLFRFIPYADFGVGGRWQMGRGQSSFEVGLGVGLSYLLGQSWSVDTAGRLSVFDDAYGALRVNYIYLVSLEYRFTFGDSFDDF